MAFITKKTCYQITRWLYVGFCVAVFGCSLALLILSSIGYKDMRTAFDELQTRNRFDYEDSATGVYGHFRPEAALGIFYFGIVIGVVFMILGLAGVVGGVYIDRCCLIFYAATLGGVLIGTIIGFSIAWNVQYKSLEEFATKLYTEFVKHLYGQPEVLTSLFATSIDSMQREHRCCGVLETDNDNATMAEYGATSTYYTVLFWLESTQFGQIQMESIDYDETKSILWTPTSCCRHESENCSRGLFEDHYIWNSAKEEYWKEQIYTIGCGRYLLDFGGNVIAAVVMIPIVFTISVVLAVVLAIETSTDPDSPSQIDPIPSHPAPIQSKPHPN